jgi:hypothetical protein
MGRGPEGEGEQEGRGRGKRGGPNNWWPRAVRRGGACVDKMQGVARRCRGPRLAGDAPRVVRGPGECARQGQRPPRSDLHGARVARGRAARRTDRRPPLRSARARAAAGAAAAGACGRVHEGRGGGTGGPRCRVGRGSRASARAPLSASFACKPIRVELESVAQRVRHLVPVDRPRRGRAHRLAEGARARAARGWARGVRSPVGGYVGDRSGADATGKEGAAPEHRAVHVSQSRPRSPRRRRCPAPARRECASSPEPTAAASARRKWQGKRQ